MNIFRLYNKVVDNIRINIEFKSNSPWDFVVYYKKPSLGRLSRVRIYFFGDHVDYIEIPYKIYLSHQLWKKKRDDILKGSPNCTFCGNKATEIHHNWDYYNTHDLDNWLEERSKDLMPLCHSCHYKIHSFGKIK